MNELSLFSGYGGFSLGFRLAGMKVRTVGYVEWETYPQEIIKARIRDGYLDDAPIWADIRAFDGTQYRGLVDIITGGFPCQPHSVAGQRQGEADERNMWPDTARVINEVGPKYVMLENVPGILHGDAGRPAYGGTVIGELSTLGYDCQWGVVGARDAGAPHKRERWWCLGVADPGRRAAREGANTPRCTETNGAALELAHSEGERYRGGYVEHPEHDGYAPSQDAGSSGSRVHPPSGEEQSEQPQRSGERGGGTGNMAHSSSEGLEGSGRSSQEWTVGQSIGHDRDRVGSWPGWGNDQLAHSENLRAGESHNNGGRTEQDKEDRIPQQLRGGSGSDARDVAHPGRDERGRRDTLRDTENQMADPSSELVGGPGGQNQGRENQQRYLGCGSSIPLWPPGPTDKGGWARVLAERPDLAPALTKEAESEFRGVDDGGPGRLDRSNRINRLKALGNGIVPAVVAEFLWRLK